jgi:hypothetical protein
MSKPTTESYRLEPFSSPKPFSLGHSLKVARGRENEENLEREIPISFPEPAIFGKEREALG